MFSVGDKIVHPVHGAGIIQKIEEKKILGKVSQYYVLKLPCSDMDVMIPTDSEISVGIRRIVDKSSIDEAINILKDKSPWTSTGIAGAEIIWKCSRPATSSRWLR